MEMVRRTVLKSVVVLMAAAFLASCDPFGLRDVLKAASRAALSLDPTDVTVPAGATVTFTAEGGVPPYSWSVSSGPGSIDADTGEYLAPLSMGSAVVRVTDAAGVTAETGVIIEDLLTGLNVTPSTLTVTVNGDVQFAAIGGTGSYTWDFASEGSGSPDINPATGYYVAGSFPGTDVVRVSDGMSPPATATVTVVALSSAVDYTVTSTGGLPSSGEAGTAIGGGVTFTLANTGTGDGAGTVSWRVYFSDDGTLGGGDVVASEGISGPLAAGGSIEVGLGGSWPNGPVGPGYLIVTVSAADDTSPGNNTAAGSPFTLDPRQVDYDVLSVTVTGGPPIAGRSLTAEFLVQNAGAALGARTIHWTAYRSDDTTLTIGVDPVVDSGDLAPLPDFLPLAVPFGGAWPESIVTKTYYLIVRASAADDVAPGNNTDVSGILTVNPPTVDYVVPNVTVNATPRRPDQPVNGTFTYQNNGLHGGTPSQALSWEVYASKNPVIDVNDTLVDSGTGLAALTTTGVPSGPIPWAGTWPLACGDYYLLARVTCAEDVNNVNNVGQSVLQTNVGVYEAEAQEPNNDYTLLTNPAQLNITLRPGMSLKIVNGAMGNADRDDIFQFNTGTATRVIVTVQWSINDQNVRIWFMDGPNSFIDGVSGLSGSMSLDWTVDAPGVNRWIDLDDYWTGSDYSPPPNPLSLTYTCWITAQ